MEQNKNKIALIEEIQKLAKIYDAAFTNDAMVAVRTGAKEDTQRAREAMIMHDVSHRLAGDIIDLIHVHWPK